jgi:hypothetical protein
VDKADKANKPQGNVFLLEQEEFLNVEHNRADQE